MRKTVHQTMKKFLPPSGSLTRKRQENRILAGGLLSSRAAKFASAFVQEQWGDRRNKQIPVCPALFAPGRNIVKKAAMRTVPFERVSCCRGSRIGFLKSDLGLSATAIITVLLSTKIIADIRHPYFDNIGQLTLSAKLRTISGGCLCPCLTRAYLSKIISLYIWEILPIPENLCGSGSRKWYAFRIGLICFT